MVTPPTEDRPAPGNPALGPASLYPPHLHRYLMRQLRNGEDARDLAQEAYLRYLQGPESRNIRKPAGYLFRIALNLMSEWRLRRDRSAVTYDSDLAERRALVCTDGAPDAFEQLTSRERLASVLQQIPDTYRRVLLMSKCEGLSHEEIARRLNVTPQTVVRYVARAVAFARHARWDEEQG